jgi:hypothetical protein
MGYYCYIVLVTKVMGIYIYAFVIIIAHYYLKKKSIHTLRSYTFGMELSIDLSIKKKTK